MGEKLCQSCAMPLDKKEYLGTNADMSPNDEYCIYCFKDGAFAQDITLDEMIEHCLLFLDEFNKDTSLKMTKEEAKASMQAFFPTLKRWAKA